VSDHVKLWRKIRKWRWFHDDHCLRLFIHMLLEANEEPSDFMGHRVGRGEFVAGRGKLSGDTGIAEHLVRTRMLWMRGKEIDWRTIETEERSYSIITLLNYDEHQREPVPEAPKPPRPPTEYQKKVAAAKRKPYSKDFEEWWPHYMVGAKGGAWFGWLEAVNKPPVEEIIANTIQYKAYCKSAGRLVADGQGYMRQRYFDTEWSHEAQGTKPEQEEGLRYGL